MIDKLLKFLGTLVFLGLVATAAVGWYTERSTDDYLYSDIEALPTDTSVAWIPLVSSYRQAGTKESVLTSRLDAVAELYTRGNISRVIVQLGPTQTQTPEDVIAALEVQKVSAEDITVITKQPSVFNGLKQVKQEEGETKVIIVSQRPQLKRVVRLARTFGIQANGYVVAEASDLGWIARGREQVARTKGFIELYWYKWIVKPNYFQYSNEEGQ
ncbi:MAG: ElyC/SanA/YdcF family protein [Candidatus Paceibacteria bacterium]